MIKKIKEILNSQDKFLIFIFILSLLIRLSYVIPLNPDKLSPDAYDWMNTAWQVVTEGTYGGTWRPPGYITYLAGVFFIFGKSILAARILNALLGSLTCVFLYFIGQKIFSSSVGRLAAFLLTFYPYLIAYTGDLISETFLTFIIALAILYVLKTSEKPCIKNIILTGIFIGYAGLTKSTVLPFFLFACAWLWWATKSFKTGFFVGIVTLLTIAPWTLRNYLYYNKDYIMPVSTPWYSFYGSSQDGALLMESQGEIDTPQTQDKIPQGAIPEDWEYISNLPLPERDRICKQKAFEWIRNNPDKYIWLLYKRFIHFWRLYPMMAYRWQKRLAMVTSGIYIPLCIVGIFLSLKNLRKTSLLLGLFVFYTLVHIFFVVTLRYRIPIDPYIIIFASFTLQQLHEKVFKISRNKPI